MIISDLIVATFENKPASSIPPIHSAVVEYDEGSVCVRVHNGDEGNTDNPNVLHINVAVIGAVRKYKDWHIVITLQHEEGGNVYLRLERK